MGGLKQGLQPCESTNYPISSEKVVAFNIRGDLIDSFYEMSITCLQVCLEQGSTP